jgi:integrase
VRSRCSTCAGATWTWRAASTATPAKAARSASGHSRRQSIGAIQAYARAAGLARKPEEAVFPGRWRDQPVDGKYIGEQLRQAAELAGIPLERPLHTLRHSYARALRRVEAPLEAVQAALDHSNLATTSIYLRQLEGQEDPWWPKLAAELGLDRGGEASPPAVERR